MSLYTDHDVVAVAAELQATFDTAGLGVKAFESEARRILDVIEPRLNAEAAVARLRALADGPYPYVHVYNIRAALDGDQS